MALDREKVQQALDEIRPYLQEDGGDCELVDIDGNQVLLRFQGACTGCPSASVTLHQGIEQHLRGHFPELEGVVAV